MKIAILFALTLTVLEAQPIEVRGFAQIAPLDGNWKFSPSDDPRFAAPDFDDSAWLSIRVPGEVIPRPLGVSWIRFAVQLPDTGGPLTLLLPPLSPSYRLFINGRPMGRFGDPEIRSEVPEIFAVPSGARNLTVALRIRRVVPALSPLLAARGAWIGTSQAIAGKQREAQLELRWWSVIHLAMMSATAMAGLFFLMLPLWRRDSWDYFWCGLYLIALVLLRPASVSIWMLDGLTINQIGISLYALAALTLYSWERLFHHLLGTQLSTWIRRFYQGTLLLHVTLVLLTPLVGPPILQINGLLAVLSSILPLVVYVDLSRRSPRREETIWMHAAVALIVGGSAIWAASVSGVGSRWLGDAAEVQHFASIVRGAGTLLFAGVMAMVLNRRSARVQREQERLAQEMRAGAEMQELLLPAGNVNVPGFTIEAAYLPMSEVGGDFYWTRAEADGALLVVVGDVSGKGLKAAMLVAVALGAAGSTKSASPAAVSPAAVLATINQALLGRTGGGFVTACCARFDRDGNVTIANAGHPSPCCDGREVEVEAGLPLGVIGDVTYEESAVPGERFTFVSDGVVEAENAQRELFGFERTREISRRPAQEIAETAKAWGQNDDITVVTVRRNP
jgi:sigma-B regulation protein RsbU (phosphoserine phosphatase)